MTTHSYPLNEGTYDVGLTKATSSLVVAAEALGKLATQKQQSLKPAAPRRGLSRVEAATYVGVSPTTFDAMVKDKLMPKPLKMGSRRVWDVRALDNAFDALAAPDEANPWDTWR